MMLPHGVRRIGIARDEAGDDGRGVRAGGRRQVDALHRRVRAALVADEQVGRVIVVRPERDLVGREMHRRRHQRDAQALRDAIAPACCRRRCRARARSCSAECRRRTAVRSVRSARAARASRSRHRLRPRTAASRRCRCGRRRNRDRARNPDSFFHGHLLSCAAALSPLDNPAASENLESGCCDAVSRGAIRCNGTGESVASGGLGMREGSPVARRLQPSAPVAAS